jgi:hypothetical protein
MATRWIMYLISGSPHLPYLVTSLYTLRNHWSGPVMVCAWDESIEIARKIGNEPRLLSHLGIHVAHDVPTYRGKCDQFARKSQLAKGFPSDTTILYLDADTMVYGDLSPLFDAAERYGFCATQFNNWTMANGIPRSRVNGLRAFPAIPAELIDRVTTDPKFPSVNGGVWATRPDSPVLPLWHEWTMAARSTFIADEKVLHLLAAKFGDTGELTVAMGGRWNCSAMEKFQPTDLPDEEVVVRHFHGDSATRPDKSPKGCTLWREVFEECCRLNIGGIRDWYRTVGNKWLNKWLKTEAEITKL